jgi:hypothetical protein
MPNHVMASVFIIFLNVVQFLQEAAESVLLELPSHQSRTQEQLNSLFYC